MKTINEEIAELRKRLDELEKRQSKGGVFVPEHKQMYWCIFADGAIHSTQYDGTRDDPYRLETGNCYPTKEAAEQIVLNRKIHRFLQEQTDFVADFTTEDNAKYFILYNCDSDSKEWLVDLNYTHLIPNIVYFGTEQEAVDAGDAAIAKFGLEAFESYLKGSIV